MQFDLEDARFWTYDRATVVEALRELEFFSMVPRIPEPEQDGARATQAELPIVEDQIETEYKIVDTPEALAELTAQLDSAQGFSFDTETTDANPKAADLVGLSFSHSTGQGWYVPVGHSEGAQLPLDLVLSSVGPILENDQVPKVGHNAKLRHDRVVQIRRSGQQPGVRHHACGPPLRQKGNQPRGSSS